MNFQVIVIEFCHKGEYGTSRQYYIECNILINQWREGVGFPRDFPRESQREGLS